MTGVQTPRERYREQVRTQIKDYAWAQLADAGASALSLNAIAKQMGMRGPSLYRYFGSRDELITELILDAYRSLADSLRTVVDSGGDAVALAHATRQWALRDPQRYLLVYGTPIPGYQAPEATVVVTAQIMDMVLDACAAIPDTGPPTSLARHLDEHREWAHGHPAPPRVLQRALTFWTRLHGVLSLELAGHFTGMRFDPEQLFTAEVEELTTAAQK